MCVVNSDDLVSVQRTFRRRFFEGPRALRWRPGRELVAQLLLYLDNPHQCWQLTTQWLRETLDADRVDGGFGGFISPNGRAVDYIVAAEAQRSTVLLPSVMGREFSAHDPGVAAVWQAPALLPIHCVEDAAVLSERMRLDLKAVGTASKIAFPLRDGFLPVGIICADWHREAPRWPHDICLEIALLARESLGPLMAATIRLEDELSSERPELDEPKDTAAVGLAAWASLTPTERRVALLIAHGVTYKEVARRLNRSLSTVDHHLRSIRYKLGVTSTSRLVHLLNQHLEPRHR